MFAGTYLERPEVDWRQSALVKAISTKNADAVTAALTLGDDPNMICGEITPLHMAASLGLPKCVQVLVDAGARTDASDDLGATALHYAATGSIADMASIARVLLDAGADASAKDYRGRTPLDYAAGFKHEAIAKVLIAAGGQCRREFRKWCNEITGDRRERGSPGPSR